MAASIDTFKTIERLVLEVGVDLKKHEDGVKIACTRCRVKLSEIGKLTKKMRAELLAERKSERRDNIMKQVAKVVEEFQPKKKLTKKK